MDITLNIKGRLVSGDRPLVMGILNATDDSFYSGSRYAPCELGSAAQAMAAFGADIIDIGACSTRPGAAQPSPAQEREALAGAVREVRKAVGDSLLVSADTYRADAALAAVDAGADIINDISAGALDKDMIAMVARLKVPYIMMHTRGTPQTMQGMTDYSEGVTAGVAKELSARIAEAAAAGITDIIADPGFGFAKTAAQNYELLANLRLLGEALQRPLLVGMSRKSMFYKPFGLTPEDVLPATTAANALAVERGAAILRVHDVAAAVQCINTVMTTMMSYSDNSL